MRAIQSFIGMDAGTIRHRCHMLSPCGSMGHGSIWAKVVVEDVADFLLSEATAKLKKCSTAVVETHFPP